MTEDSLDFYPFAYALLDEQLFNYCWFCLAGKEAVSLKKCNACKAALYCNSVCQHRGWIDHKAECVAIRRVQGVVDVEIRLLGRIVYRYKQIKDGNDKDPEFYINRHSDRSIMDICAHEDSIRNDAVGMEKFEELYARLHNFYSPKFMLDKEIVYKLHCRNYINRHAISNADYTKEIGKGLFLDLCAYDHSCRPNVIFSCDGVKAIMRPLNDKVNLKNRKTTFYTYIDLLVARQPRQKMLKDTWYFDCKCDRCLDDADHILSALRCDFCSSNIVAFGSLAIRDVKHALHCPKCNKECPAWRMHEAFELMRHIDTIVNNEKACNSRQLADELMERGENILAAENVYLTKVYQLCIAYTQESEIERALTLHLKALPCLQICYPKNHPTLAHHHYTIGCLFAKFKNDNEHIQAQWHYEQAEEQFTCSLGPNHTRTKMVREKIAILTTEEIKTKDAECKKTLKEPNMKKKENDDKNVMKQIENRQEEIESSNEIKPIVTLPAEVQPQNKLEETVQNKEKENANHKLQASSNEVKQEEIKVLKESEKDEDDDLPPLVPDRKTMPTESEFYETITRYKDEIQKQNTKDETTKEPETQDQHIILKEEEPNDVPDQTNQNKQLSNVKKSPHEKSNQKSNKKKNKKRK